MNNFAKFLQIALIIIFNSTGIFSCSCSSERIANRIAASEFIGIIRIDSVRVDKSNSDFHTLEVNTKEVFKGVILDTISVHSYLNSSCAFLPAKGSTWLVFAYTFQNRLSFGYCSSPTNMNIAQTPNHPKAFSNRTKRLERRLSVLREFKTRMVDYRNDYNLHIGPPKTCLDSLKGFDNPELDFEVYQATVEEDLSVSGIIKLKSFANADLADYVSKCVNQIDKAHKHRVERIEARTTVTFHIFYYAAGREYLSFLSTHDL